jgi:hypothetical protein
MKIIGFNLTKILVERPAVLKSNFSVNNHIEFLEVEKEELDIVKDVEPVRIKFAYTVTYDSSDSKDKKKESDSGNLVFEGVILLALDKEVSKELLKSWKKKEITPEFKLPLFNLILRKCTPKALDLEDQIGLPLHVPLPKIGAAPKQDKS